MQGKLKVGIVGCGNIANVHMRYIPQYTDRSNIALCDLDEFRLLDFAERTNIKQTYTDLGKMMEEFRPDVIHIVTPPATHKNIAIECLKEGCHVLIEKPIALSTEEADAIIEVAREHKRLVCVDHMRVLDPLILKVKDIIQSGKMGEVVNISAGYSYDYFQRLNTDPTVRWMSKLLGGAFFDVIPHPLSVIEEFLPDAKIKSSVCLKNSENTITDVSCIFASSSGSASLHMSFKTFPLKNYIEFECERGTLKVDHRNFLLLVRRSYGLPNAIERIAGNFSMGLQMIWGTTVNVFRFLLGKLDSYAGLNKMIGDFYQAIADGQDSPVSGETAKKILAFTETIFRGQQTFIEEIPLAELQEADVLVTGGTGFIGRRLVNQLLDQGLRVRILSHRPIDEEKQKSYFTKPVEVVEGDVYSFKTVEYALQGVKTVYHLAAAMKGDWYYHMDTTITGTKNILLASEKEGVEDFIYASTLNVYAASSYPENESIDEKFPYEPEPQKRGSYSRAKLKAEGIVSEKAKKSNMRIFIVRPGLVYGPGGKTFFQDVGYRIGKALTFVMGNGERRLPLVYVDHLIDALLKLRETKDRKGIFNVVDDDYPSQKEYIKIYKQLTGEKFLTLYVPFWIFRSLFWVLERLLTIVFKKRVALLYRLDCIRKSPRHSTSRLKKAIHWRTENDFEQGLKNTIESANAKPVLD